MTNYGPPGASSNGFNENLSLFQQGKCGMWIDATVAAGFVTDPEESTVADNVGYAVFPNKEGVDNHGNWLWSWNLGIPESTDAPEAAKAFVTNPDDSSVADQVGFALAPDNGLGKRGNWLWAWSLGIPAGTDSEDAAKTFVAWATSKEYTQLVAEKEGWANVPPGTRTSLYENEEYQKVPFAEMTLNSIEAADPTNPTVDPVPYTGVQFVAIPEFAGIGTQVGQEFSAALAGQQSVEQALENAQAITTDEMEAAGY